MVRWAGRAAIAAGPLYAVFLLAHPDAQGVVAQPLWWIVDHVIGLVSWILALVAFAGIAVVAASHGGWDVGVRRGRAAVTGWGLLLLAGVLQSGVLYGEAFYYPALAGAAPSVGGEESPLGELPAALLYLVPNLILIVGAVTVAATVRASGLRYPAVLAFAVGAVLIAFPPISELILQIGALVYAVGLVWVGIDLTRRAPNAAQALLGRERLSPAS